MKKLYLYVINIVFILTFFLKSSFGQFNFIFFSDLNARSIEGLGIVQTQNLTGKILTGIVVIEVKEVATRTSVVSIKIPEQRITTGLSTLSRSIFINSQLHFYNNSYGNILSQTRQFPAGEYLVCYSFISTDKNIPFQYDDCFDFSIKPLVPVSLQSPYNKDSICEKKPFLSWKPPLPYNNSIRFRVLLTEKKNGVASIENLLVNIPLLYVDNISGVMINYPTSSPDLKDGITYCWQVIAYQNGILLSKSEIWEFTVNCTIKESLKPNDSYRELKSLINGNYYVANNTMKFSFFNHYHEQQLQYAIYEFNSGMKPLKKIPKIYLKRGLNRIDIDLNGLELTPEKQYVLRVFPFNENPVDIVFKTNVL